jgi:hypothetical protein
MGYCSRYSHPGFMNQAAAFRGGFGYRGSGRGWRHRFCATGNPDGASPTLEQETTELKTQAEWLKEQLDTIQKRIDELTLK